MLQAITLTSIVLYCISGGFLYINIDTLITKSDAKISSKFILPSALTIPQSALLCKYIFTSYLHRMIVIEKRKKEIGGWQKVGRKKEKRGLLKKKKKKISKDTSYLPGGPPAVPPIEPDYPTTARQECLGLLDVSKSQSTLFPTPSHPWVPPE